MKMGVEYVEKHDLSSLRLLGSVGEPINPEAWMWYHQVIGQERCPIVDTWWQTETGGIMLAPIPGVTATVTGSACVPFFGVDAAILDVDGQECDAGILAIRQPWPGMTRGVYGDPKRLRTPIGAIGTELIICLATGRVKMRMDCFGFWAA